MDGNMPNEAGDQLAAPQADQGGGKVVTIPSDLLPQVKPGDSLKVQSVADGNVTLEFSAGMAADSDESWGADAAQAVKGAM